MTKIILLLCFLSATIMTIAQTTDRMNVRFANTKDTVGVFEKVEFEAQFPGGLEGWRTYLTQNMKMEKIMASVPKRTKHWQQQAVVQFIVCKDGSICDIKVINAVSPAVAKEAKRIIAASPAWEPAMQNGRQVKAYRKQPITFVVDSE